MTKKIETLQWVKYDFWSNICVAEDKCSRVPKQVLVKNLTDFYKRYNNFIEGPNFAKIRQIPTDSRTFKLYEYIVTYKTGLFIWYQKTYGWTNSRSLTTLLLSVRRVCIIKGSHSVILECAGGRINETFVSIPVWRGTNNDVEGYSKNVTTYAVDSVLPKGRPLSAHKQRIK